MEEREPPDTYEDIDNTETAERERDIDRFLAREPRTIERRVRLWAEDVGGQRLGMEDRRIKHEEEEIGFLKAVRPGILRLLERNRDSTGNRARLRQLGAHLSHIQVEAERSFEEDRTLFSRMTLPQLRAAALSRYGVDASWEIPDEGLLEALLNLHRSECDDKIFRRQCAAMADFFRAWLNALERAHERLRRITIEELRSNRSATDTARDDGRHAKYVGLMPLIDEMTAAERDVEKEYCLTKVCRHVSRLVAVEWLRWESRPPSLCVGHWDPLTARGGSPASAPRPVRRPSGKARRPRISGIFGAPRGRGGPVDERSTRVSVGSTR
jgi:hypothetical protein